MIEFYDSKNMNLASLKFKNHKITRIINPERDGMFFYSIDLVDIPILLRDKTTKINITHHKER